MHDDWYRQLIGAFCEAAGIQDPDMVAASKQIEVNGYVLALFPEATQLPALGLYVELMPYEGGGNAGLFRRLLESNTVEDPANGFFCLIPGADMVAYRTTMRDVDRLSGQGLMQHMLELVACAAAQLHGVMSQRSRSARLPKRTASVLLKEGLRA